MEHNQEINKMNTLSDEKNNDAVDLKLSNWARKRACAQKTMGIHIEKRYCVKYISKLVTFGDSSQRNG